MRPSTPDLLAALRQRRRTVIGGFLWTLLGIVLLTILLSGVLLGPERVSLAALAPNLVFATLIGTALWLNGRDRFGPALGLILTVTLGAAGVQVASGGVEGASPVLYLFFVPAVLAGLLLIRRIALYLTAGTTLLTVLGTLALQRAGLHPQPLMEPEAATAATLQFAIVFTLVVFFLDRFGLALTNALVSAAERDVALSNEVLERRVAERTARASRRRVEALNENLEVRVERLEALHEIDKAITGPGSLGATLEVALAQVQRCLHVDASSVLLYAPAEGHLRFAAARGLRTTGLREKDVALGEGLAGHAALRLGRVIVTDPIELRQAYAHPELIEDEGFAAYVAMPLVAKGKLHGVLELFHRSHPAHDEEWFAFLTTLATQIAIALDNARLVEHLERSNDELNRAYDTTIEGWARALDLKDAITEGHSRRVTDVTVSLARSVGVSDEDLEHVRRGALLHDIGKMGVPDTVLQKPGRLDAKEWELMKTHPTLAYEFLAPIEFLRPALDIPYAHHERWDGSGYPRGLRGEQIPLAARLFAVVDVYDALTSDRPYREAWGRERALEHIREGAGSHFDPAAVEALLAHLATE